MPSLYVPGKPNPYFPKHQFHGVSVYGGCQRIEQCKPHHYAGSCAMVEQGVAAYVLSPEHLWATFQVEAENLLKMNGKVIEDPKEKNKRMNAAYARIDFVVLEGQERETLGRRRTHAARVCCGRKLRPTLKWSGAATRREFNSCGCRGRGLYMKARNRPRVMLAGLLVASLWWYNHTPEPTLLSFRVGQPFEEVVGNSTYPVMERSNLPADDKIGFGATWVTEPAVIVHFNDPKHGFTLPPTKFAALSYQHNVASTLASSPMLEKLPFAQAVKVLENLQNQFKAGGWEPYDVHRSTWFDLTTEGRKQLNSAMFKPPFYQQQTLRVPKKYAMTFRLLCAEGCWTREPPYLFLIQIGLSDDNEGSEPGDPPIWDKSHPANQVAGGPAQPKRADPR